MNGVKTLQERRREYSEAGCRARHRAPGEWARLAAAARIHAQRRVAPALGHQVEHRDALGIGRGGDGTRMLQAELDRTRALATVKLAEARLARALGR